MPIDRRPPGMYRAPGYPVGQLLFCSVAAAVVLSIVRADPVSAARGATLIALGIPVYYWYAVVQSRQSRERTKATRQLL
jgi:hypothetical protein